MTGPRLLRLYAAGRRVPLALLSTAVCATGLRIALLRHWDAYGALQLPLIFEAAAAVSVTATAASPFGEPERVAGRLLPYLRAAVTVALTAAAVGLLTAAGTGGHLSGGTLDVLRNVAGITGIGLLCAAVLGGGLSWTGPTGYLVAAVYALYTQWHPPVLATPWLWPARPPHDLGGALCAGLLFGCGLAAVTVRGARDRIGDPAAA
ncbi:hypothetical protein [Streptacidiphilus carbonis]|uniref:hypothetical protein n=1 Tax=Streptacidiphilus carbonis TaxID=105422 RepID=UPI0005AA1228|nr:hypothetical protein [Streptacidiphilus carbonis]